MSESIPNETVQKNGKLDGKKSKKSKVPAFITPEYIENQRRLRNLKKEQKRKELLAQGIDPDQPSVPASLNFIKRPQLEVSSLDDDGIANFSFKIMSYNLLAQALIRRKLFPTSGNALKWSNRSLVLLGELKHYDADILCLQEVDSVQYESYWKHEFKKLGYESKYFKNDTKNHGVAIVFKTDFFECHDECSFKYDDEASGTIPPRTLTQNVGLLLHLGLTESIKSKFNIKRNGLIIGTTHLFWHPFGTYERSRQTFIVLNKVKEFQNKLNSSLDNDKGFYTFFAGDFNSQPFDSPYLSITAKPVSYAGRAETVISCSLSFEYSKNRGILDEESMTEEEGGNIEKFGENQPKDPVPDSFHATELQLAMVKQMENLHNELPMRAVSLYSVGYRLVDPENAGTDNDRGEPTFSNWAHAWRGLLDYIFVITPWDPTSEDYSEKVDSLSEVENRDGVKLLKLLKLPMPKDMGPEPSGQPRLGQYPSDHLCLMAQVALD